jgi:hypothetical protein
VYKFYFRVSQIGDPAFGGTREFSDGHNVYHSSCESFDSAEFAGIFLNHQILIVNRWIIVCIILSFVLTTLLYFVAI